MEAYSAQQEAYRAQQDLLEMNWALHQHMVDALVLALNAKNHADRAAVWFVGCTCMLPWTMDMSFVTAFSGYSKKCPELARAGI